MAESLEDSDRYACSPWVQESSRSQANSINQHTIGGFNPYATLQVKKS